MKRTPRLHCVVSVVSIYISVCLTVSPPRTRSNTYVIASEAYRGGVPRSATASHRQKVLLQRSPALKLNYSIQGQGRTQTVQKNGNFRSACDSPDLAYSHIGRLLLAACQRGVILRVARLPAGPLGSVGAGGE